MDSKHYYIGFKTKPGDGTDSNVMLHLFDINGHAISDPIEVTHILHNKTGDALLEGSFQFGVFEMPTPGSFEGVPEVYFLNLEMMGNDEWACDYIEVAPVPPGTLQERDGWTQEKLNKLKLLPWGVTPPPGLPNIGNEFEAGSRFTFNETFSTTSSEGPTSKQIARDGYHPETRGEPTVDDREMSSFNITDNIGGSSEANSNAEEVKKVRQNNVSLTEGSGDNKSNSIATGVTFGYKPPSATGGVDASFSTTYTHSWGTWHSSQQVQELLDTTARTYTFPSSKIPKATLRISRFTVQYKVTTISVSNGVDAPVKIELIGEQGLDNVKSENHDITKENAKTAWPPLKASVIEADPSQKNDMESAEENMRSAGWL